MDCRKIDDVWIAGANNEVFEPRSDAEQPGSLGPKTPVADRENVDISSGFDSPFTTVKTVPIAACFDSYAQELGNPFSSVGTGSPRTPKDSVFDPFAPGPKSMALAPARKKYTNSLKTSTVRPLRFDSSFKSDNPNSVLDQKIFKTLYENLLELLVSKHMEEISDRNVDYDNVKTPTSATRLSGIADTCPGAPTKPPRETRNIDIRLCRKLF